MALALRVSLAACLVVSPRCSERTHPQAARKRLQTRRVHLVSSVVFGPKILLLLLHVNTELKTENFLRTHKVPGTPALGQSIG